MNQKEFLKQDRSILYIDATDKPAVVYLWSRSGLIDEKVEIENGNLSEMLLASIKSLCHDAEIDLCDIAAVGVNPGPGSYTGLRIGITTANLLAFTLNRPVFAAKPNEVSKKWKSVAGKFSNPILPFYAKVPHITTSKPRLK